MLARETEPLRVTLARTVGIALIAGGAIASQWGGLSRWPMTSLLMLWPSLGGHYVELAYLDWVRPRLSGSRSGHIIARIGVWFVAGVLLMLAMRLTGIALHAPRPLPAPAWWIGGLVFIGIELIAHFGLHVYGRPSFYNGRG